MYKVCKNCGSGFLFPATFGLFFPARSGYLRPARTFFHDLQHYPGAQLKSILEYQAICCRLALTDSVRVAGEQFFFLVCHGGLALFFASAEQIS